MVLVDTWCFDWCIKELDGARRFASAMKESQRSLARWQTWDGLVKCDWLSALVNQLGKMSADEYHERSKASDNKVWAP